MADAIPTRIRVNISRRCFIYIASIIMVHQSNVSLSFSPVGPHCNNITTTDRTETSETMTIINYSTGFRHMSIKNLFIIWSVQGNPVVELLCKK